VSCLLLCVVVCFVCFVLVLLLLFVVCCLLFVICLWKEKFLIIPQLSSSSPNVVLAQRNEGGVFERAILSRRFQGKTWVSPEGGGDEYVANTVCEVKIMDRFHGATAPGPFLDVIGAVVSADYFLLHTLKHPLLSLLSLPLHLVCCFSVCCLLFVVCYLFVEGEISNYPTAVLFLSKCCSGSTE